MAGNDIAKELGLEWRKLTSEQRTVPGFGVTGDTLGNCTCYYCTGYLRALFQKYDDLATADKKRFESEAQ